MKIKIVIILVFALCCTGAMSASAQTLGDVNANGVVDIVDALMVAQYYVGTNPPGFVTTVADVNCSGGIDIVDALVIAQYYVGLIIQFPCSATPTATPATPVSTPTGTPSPTPSAGVPVGNFSFWPQVISTSDTVFFYGLASYGTGSAITGYSWNFGDGSVASGANASHKYAATGNYTATLTVTDSTGHTGTRSGTVSVSLASGQSTTDNAIYNFEDATVQGFVTNNANSTIASTVARPYSGTRSLQWNVTATASEIVEVRINGPARVKPGTKVLFRIWIPSGAQIDNVQPYVMPHNADWTLTEWNADWQPYSGLTKDAWREFSVMLPGTTNPAWEQQIGIQVKTTGAGSFTMYVDSIDWPNTKTPPKASFDYSPDRPSVNVTVSFDAANSSDAFYKSVDQDGTISGYVWDFGDGTNATGATATHAYAQAGKYPVTLTVTDNDGLNHSLTRVTWCGQAAPAFAPPLSVSGEKILDANGIRFIPKAVSVVDSLNYTLADFIALRKEWKVDMIRLPYITDRWYYNVDAAARETYLATFDKYLDWTYQAGIYVLLDAWHEGGSTGNVDYHFENCKAAWKIIAPRLANRTHIIWEVYNEPYEISWASWVPKAEQLIDIIMSYNPVVKVFAVPGTNWAQDFDVRTLKVNRPNVIYSAHPYPHVYNATWTPAAWDTGFGYIVTEGYAPVLATEFIYPLFDKGERTTYGEPICRYFAERNIGWFAWIWGGWGGPESRDPNSYRTDCWQFLWEHTNGLWN